MTHPIQAVKPMLRALLNVLFPVFCPICGRSIPDSAFLCTHCITTLPPLPKNYCLTCGTSTQGTVSECGTCLYEIGLPERVYFAFLYLEPLSRLIVRYKFHDRSEWAEPLADLLMERIGDLMQREDLEMVVPVPLHPLRLLWRGYNQAALLAGMLAKKLHRPFVTNALRRSKMTRPQTQLNQKARLTNVQDAFVAKKTTFSDRTILLVDDVFTTGSTVRAATRALKDAGARRVVVCCLARVDY
ncbi:MAG: ComF family protein [Magnetococcales bacterium]|nr:ComF family protein [Magnetococcales bacterium]